MLFSANSVLLFTSCYGWMIADRRAKVVDLNEPLFQERLVREERQQRVSVNTCFHSPSRIVKAPYVGVIDHPAVQAGASTSKVDKWSGRKHILEMLGFHRALSRLVIGLPRLSRARKCRGDFYSISSKKDLVKSRGF
jgi:hypothetical protein